MTNADLKTTDSDEMAKGICEIASKFLFLHISDISYWLDFSILQRIEKKIYFLFTIIIQV